MPEPNDNLALVANLAVKASGIEQAQDAIDGDKPAAVVADGQKIVLLEAYRDGRRRLHGTLVTRSIPDFAAYVKARTEETETDTKASVFIDPDALKAVAFFNLGLTEDNLYGHGDDRAALTLKATAAYTALVKLVGSKFKQRDLAEWLEDWVPNLTAYVGEGTEVSMNAAIAAVRDVSIKKKSEGNSQAQDLQSTRSAMEEVLAESRKVLPTAFRFTCIPYVGLGSRSFALRLSVSPVSEEPIFQLRVQSLEQAQEDIARDFQSILSAALGDAAVCTLGSYTP